MAFDQGLIDWVAEALAPVGAVTMRRMMGAAALYLDGTIFAIVAEDVLWLKGDAESESVWDAAGCDRFTFESQGTTKSTSYRRAPQDVYHDADAMREWAALAVAAGLRAAAKKPRRKRSA